MAEQLRPPVPFHRLLPHVEVRQGPAAGGAAGAHGGPKKVGPGQVGAGAGAEVHRRRHWDEHGIRRIWDIFNLLNFFFFFGVFTSR